MPKTYVRTLQVSFNIAASAPAGSIIGGTITDLQNGTSGAYIQVPTTQSWTIVDIYDRGSGDVPVDGVVTLTTNSLTNVLTTDPISSLNISNPSRPHYQPLELRPGTTLTAKLLTLVANGTSAATDNIFLKIQVVDYSS